MLRRVEKQEKEYFQSDKGIGKNLKFNLNFEIFKSKKNTGSVPIPGKKVNRFEVRDGQGGLDGVMNIGAPLDFQVAGEGDGR